MTEQLVSLKGGNGRHGMLARAERQSSGSEQDLNCPRAPRLW